MVRFPYHVLKDLYDSGFRVDLNKNFEDIAADIKDQISRIDQYETESKNRDNVLQNQINTLVVHGDSSPQAAQASIGADGTDYGGNLKARLDDEYNHITGQLKTLNLDKVGRAYLDVLLSTWSGGGPKDLFYSVNALLQTYPNGTNGPILVFDTAFSEGAHSFFWKDGQWIDLGMYQGDGIKDKSVTREKLSDELQNKIMEEWAEDSILYGLVDKDGRCVFSIDKNGIVKIHKLDLTNNLEFDANSIKQISIENTVDIDEDISAVLWGIIDSEGRMSELVLGEDGKVPEWVMKEWATRLRLKQTAIETFQEIDTEASGLLWGIVDSEGRMSELVLDESGQVPDRILNSWKARMNKQDDTASDTKIVFPGDSLTAGAGGNGTTYPNVVANLTGKTVVNLGVGGEGVSTITARQGGSTMLVNNVTIPATTTAVKIGGYDTPILNNVGKECRPLRQGSAGVNPCYINGIKGTMTITQTSSTSNDFVYYFTRSEAGSEVVINRPTPIITDAMKYKDMEHILSIFIGQNGGYNDSPAELINEINTMINHANTDKYIVLGLSSGTKDSRKDMEKAMSLAFGRHYINLRDYLSKYGLADAGITLTQADLDAMAVGAVPPSLLVDTVHFNAAGYTVIGNLIYKKIIELGYI